MTNTVLERQVEAWALDLMLNAEPLKCQGKHEKFPEIPCSVEVTHRVHDCRGTRVICRNAAETNLQRLRETPHALCEDCDEPIKDCWAVFPI